MKGLVTASMHRMRSLVVLCLAFRALSPFAIAVRPLTKVGPA